MASVDFRVQARAAVLAYRWLAVCVLLLAIFGAGLMADGLTVGAYRLAPLGSWRAASLIAAGLVVAVVGAEIIRLTTLRILAGRAL